MILIAPHDPLPLLNEVDQREESFDREYLKKEPKEVHIKFTRTA